MNVVKVLVLFLAMFGHEMLYSQIKIMYGPYLQNLYDSEVTVVWESDKESVGWVEIAPDDGSHFYSEERSKHYDSTNGVKNVSALHSVRIKGLLPGKTYMYRVYSQEVTSHKGVKVHYGDIAATDVYYREPLRFTTLDPNKKEVSFLMINDIHGRDSIAEALLQIADYKNKDLIFFNGDMVSEFKDKESIFNGFMSRSIKMFASEKPMYYARGNHETRGEFATSFQNYFSPEEEHLYYVFRHGPVAFVVLDTGEDKPDTDIEYSGITDYDAYRTEESGWLQRLSGMEWPDGVKFVVAVFHMPPFAEAKAWHGQKEVLDKFVPALNKMNVDIMLCGHTHKTEYEEAGNLVKSPILVNSNNSVVSVAASEDRMDIEIIDLDGKVVFKKSLTSGK